jgi:hypothetical protein
VRSFTIVGTIIAAVLFIAGEAIARQAGAAAQPSRYSPPAATAITPNQLEILQVEVSQNNVADAVRRLDSLLHTSGDGFVAFENGGTISLATWVSLLSDETKNRMAAEAQVQFGDVAARAVSQLDNKPFAEIADYLAVARRYPFTTAAANALISAARRSAALGDMQAMKDLLDRAANEYRLKPDSSVKRLMSPTTAAAGNSHRDHLVFIA